MAVENCIQIEGVVKRYGSVTAVDDLSLAVPAGSLYGFIGPNGSGKTTTLRMILSIIRPDTGRIEVLGRSDFRAANDHIGYLPEERGLYKKMSVLDQLVYYGTLKGLSPRAARQAGMQWLQRLERGQWATKKIESLSKGMAQKAQFITAVMASPQLLILDGPFSGLDPVNLETLREAMLELRAGGTTVIFSTHDMSMAERMCDFIFMICRGQKVLDGSLDEIRSEYGSDTIRLRLGEGAAALEGIAGIEHVIDQGQVQDVRYGGDPQYLLEMLMQKTQVSHFEITRPSLHDIFLRIAGNKAAEQTEAA